MVTLMIIPVALLAWKTVELAIDFFWTVFRGEQYSHAALRQLTTGTVDFESLDRRFARRQPLRQAARLISTRLPLVGRAISLMVDVGFRAPSLILVAIVIIIANQDVFQHDWYMYTFIGCIAGLIIGTVLVELFQLVIFGDFNPYKRDWAIRPSAYSRSARQTHTWELQHLMLFMIALVFISIVGFSAIYYALYLNDPAHFNFGRHGSSAVTSLYFSTVTMATVGYGEVHPMSDMARAFVILQILTGPLSLILVIPSWLSRQRFEG